MATQDYHYDVPEDYTYDTNKIEVLDGRVHLKEDLTDVYLRYHLESIDTLDSVEDSSGNGRDGTAINSPSIVTGKINNGFQFDGIDQYINCENIASFERTDAWTVEFWIKTTSTDLEYIVSKQDNIGLSRGWGIRHNSGLLQIRIINSGSNLIALNRTTGAINDGAFHHVIWTYDGSSTASGNKIYVDNSLISLTTVANSLSSTIINSIDLQVSGRKGLNDLFVGTLDEVLIYNKALSSDEVTFRYHSGVGSEHWYYYSDKPTVDPTALLDPAVVISWDSFTELLGGNNEGSIGYNLYKVNKTNRYYWNGTAWISGGSTSNYNTVSTINTNIGTFDASPDKIGFIAYLLSDGEQEVDLHQNQIVYTINQNPTVNAGSNKTVKDNNFLAVFSDSSFSDSDGTVDHVYYKIDGEVDVWTEIPINGYGSLLEAVRAFEYQFTNSGTQIARLQAEDNLGGKNEDSLEVDVQQFEVTFNIKDTFGNHLADVFFNPGDGTGYASKNSPFIYNYDYSAVDYDIVLDKSGYTIETQSVPAVDNIENFTLISIIQESQLVEKMNRVLGLVQENSRIFNPVYDKHSNMTSALVRTYPTPADVDANTNVLAEYRITSVYDRKNRMTSYRSKKI